MLHHIVFFKLKNREKYIKEGEAILRSIDGNIDFIRALKVGVDVVHSDRAYDLALMIKFDSLEDMERYQIHPYHVNDVKGKMQHMVESSVSVDFEE